MLLGAGCAIQTKIVKITAKLRRKEYFKWEVIAFVRNLGVMGSSFTLSLNHILSLSATCITCKIKAAPPVPLPTMAKSFCVARTMAAFPAP